MIKLLLVFDYDNISVTKYDIRKKFRPPQKLMVIVILIYFSHKQLPREMESRLVIIECAGYTF